MSMTDRKTPRPDMKVELVFPDGSNDWFNVVRASLAQSDDKTKIQYCFHVDKVLGPKSKPAAAPAPGHEDETFGERVARLCEEKGVPKAHVRTVTGTTVANIARNRTVSLRSAEAIAKLLGMTLWELNAPVLYPATTRELVDAGLIRENGK